MKTIRQMSMTVGFCITSYVAFSQTVPTGAPPAPNTNARAAAAWYRGGNTATSPNNIFGTMWNSPIYTYSDSQRRMKLNGSFNGGTQYTIEGYTFAQGVNTSGYLLLGQDGATQNGNPSLFDSKGAFSMLHLNGIQNSGGGGFVQEFGYRPWMQTGVTFTGNNDLMYFGIRRLATGQDLSEMGITWSDNSGTGFPGPDDMVFRFTAGGNGNNTISNNLNDVTDLDGLHIARFTGNGEFGLGNTFGADNPLYIRPTSLQHLSLSDMRSVYTQYTNRNTAVGSGTAETANDGLRLGINGDNNANVNGNALMYNQENRHILFSTNNNTNFVNIGNGITLERMRITAIAAPTSLASGGYGVNNPAGLNGNLTRVAISHNPQSPVTRPLSLLHLGYNTGANSLFPTATDGWRNWMDIGMFVSNGTDNTYLGLKQETGIGGDRQDAVLNWGDNDASNPLFGPDNLRFIFTSTTTGSGNSPANSNNGLETARISPAAATTMGTNFGMMGIGDFSPTGPNAAPINQPNAKLDIDGDLRIRTVTKRDSLMQVLVIDSNDHNRVHWRNISGLGNVTANNGVSVDATTGAVQLGVPCQDSLGNNNIPEITANAFTEDRVVAIGDFNLWFATYAGDKGCVGIGGQPASTPFCGTGNTLEISANGASKYGAASSSGLRFTHLTSDSLTVPVGTNGVLDTKVLTVDNDGDVVLVDAVGGGNVTADNGLSIDPLNANNVQLGQECGSASSTANLLSDREIPLNDFNLTFSGQGTTGNNVGIGTTCTPIAKLQVDKTGITTMSDSRGFYVHNSEQSAIYTFGAQIYTDANSPYSYGVDVLAINSVLNNTGIHTIGWGGDRSFGVSSGSGMSSILNIGVAGSSTAPNSSSGWGVEGFAKTSGGNTGENVGVYGSATGSLTQNFGGRFLANSSTGTNYGVYAQAPNTSTLLGPHYAGYFAGDLLYTGQFGVSDQMFKKNIDSIPDALSIISKLLPRTYLNDVINYSKLGFNDSKQYGFVAQEVELVLPELVGKGIHPDEYDTNGVKINSSFNFKTLNYQAFIPILTKGIQEQQLVIDSMSNTIQIQDSINNDLENRLAYLENCIRNANICTEGNKTTNTESGNTTNYKSIELTNNSSIILDQNLPNPFAENTVINYNIPTDVMEAKLLFYDLNGRIIKELIIDERGESKLTVYGENLQSGVYTYSLIADGELIATKKMVKK